MINITVSPISNDGVIRLAFIGGNPEMGNTEDKTFCCKYIDKEGAITTIREWCAKHDKMEYIDDWDWDMNDYSPDELSSGSNKTIYIKCHKGVHDSIKTTPYSLTKRKKILCDKCNSFAQYMISRFGEDYFNSCWDWEKNDISPWDISYSSTKEVYLICQNTELHGSYKVVCNTLAYSPGNLCPYCNIRPGTTPLLGDSLGYRYPDVFGSWEKSNEITPYDVTPSSHRITTWICDKHGRFERSVSESVRYCFRCPRCSAERRESILQEKVSSYIEGLGFHILHEYDCNILPERAHVKNNRFLPFDNEVVELQLIVEVHGKQHYVANSWHSLTALRNGTTTELEFKNQQERDAYKMQYAIDRGYNYLIIPYTSEKDDYYKTLITEKIFEIQQKESVTTTV